MMDKRIATTKPDWKMPSAPNLACDECGKLLIHPYAYDTGGEWLFYWGCADNHEVCDPDSTFINEWPFIDDQATPDDIRLAEFKIVGG